MAKPVTEVLRAWITAHMPPESDAEFDAGYRALGEQLLAELEGEADLPE